LTARPRAAATFGDDLQFARRGSLNGRRTGETFPLLSGDDLLRQPDLSWLIDGPVPASGLSVLYGASGAGKSFLALELALCVATGLPWLDREVRSGLVVYIAAEGQAGLGPRYRAWLTARGLETAERIRFLTDAVDLRDGHEVDRVHRTLATLLERPRPLVVDTMARTMTGGDENAAKDVGQFIAAVDGLREADAALVVHHSGKDGVGERGSSALRAAADLMPR
jgi:RecA-family ATPase